MKVLTVASLKGGVGKSSLCLGLAQAFVSLKQKVLVIDLDPNNNLTDFFLRNISEEEAEKVGRSNVYHVLTQGVKVEASIYKGSGGVDILPCTQGLHRASLELSSDPMALLRFRKALRTLPYDLILIDTPPAFGIELRAGLYASDLILSPVYPHRWIEQGQSLLNDEVLKIEKAMGSSPALVVVPYMVTTEKEKKHFDALKLTPTLKNGIPRRSGIRKKAESAMPFSGKDAEIFKQLAEEVTGKYL